MDRPDRDLAFMLRYENIAWYEDGAVRILDRRCYPRTVSFVTCTHYGEVAQAIAADGMEAVFTPTDNTIMSAELSIYEILAEAKIPHYAGADSFALNGAFLGYGVDYANLGRETADMIAAILVDGADPAATPVQTFDNGTATVNTETCEAIGFDFEAIKEAFGPYCTKVQEITTAEAFE